ncbi:MAG: DUF2344 domain-containing protein [Firmicutes bacterium]|jgi:radical SAM-linked protein|nr:DUF2344 domain-containing protein [Bacillota bacterium]
MRYRLRLAKLESAVFVSHLGTMRAFERAVRRARLPVAYTEGYHPHPKYSFATALGVGMTSEAEYVDIELIDRADSPVGSRAVLEAVGRELPPGLSVLAVAQVMEGSRTGLASGIRWASYRVEISLGMALAAAELLGQASFEIEIAGKGGKKTVDVRPMVRCAAPQGRALEFTIACGGRAHLRPGDFLSALGSIAGEKVRTDGFGVHRTGLFFEVESRLVAPEAHECTDLVIAAGL